MGVLAAKLVLTVCKKSSEKRMASERPNPRLDYVKQQVEKIATQLSRNLERDSIKFGEVIDLRRAKAIAKDRQEEAALSRQANDALVDCTEIVFEIASDCLQLVDHAKVAFDEGWPAIRGDAGAALSSALAGAMSCIFIANLNAKSLRRKRYSQNIVDRCKSIYDEILRKQGIVASCIGSLGSEAIEAIDDLLFEDTEKEV